MRASGGSTGASSRGWRRRRSSAPSWGRSSPTMSPRACSMPRSQPYSSGAASTWPCVPSAPMTRERLRLWPAVAGGLGIGALGGAVGVILGTLRMPTLVRLVGMDVKRAAGTNLVVGFLLGVAGFAAHAGARRRRLGRSCSPAWPARYRAAGSAPERRGRSTRTCSGSRSASSSCSSARSSPRRPSV